MFHSNQGMPPCIPYRERINLQNKGRIISIKKIEKTLLAWGKRLMIRKLNMVIQHGSNPNKMMFTLHFLHVYIAMLYRSSSINLSRRRAEDSLSAISSSDATIPEPRRLWSSSARPSQMSDCDRSSDNSSVYGLFIPELPASDDEPSASLLFSELIDNHCSQEVSAVEILQKPVPKDMQK